MQLIGTFGQILDFCSTCRNSQTITRLLAHFIGKFRPQNRLFMLFVRTLRLIPDFSRYLSEFSVNYSTCQGYLSELSSKYSISQATYPNIQVTTRFLAQFVGSLGQICGILIHKYVMVYILSRIISSL